MNLTLSLLAVHLLAVIFWVGSLVSITRLLGVAQQLDGEPRARLTDGARAIYRGVASSAMGVALLAGLGLMGLIPGLFRAGWFHPKLTAALVMLVLHFLLGARIRRAQAAGDDAAWRAAVAAVRGIQWAVLAAATLAVVSVTVLKAIAH